MSYGVTRCWRLICRREVFLVLQQHVQFVRDAPHAHEDGHRHEQLCGKGGFLWLYRLLHLPDSGPPPPHYQRLRGALVSQQRDGRVHGHHLQRAAGGEEDRVSPERRESARREPHVHEFLRQEAVNAHKPHAVRHSA